MLPDHPFIEDIPAYAIGALDVSERAALEQHLKTCELCQAELSAYHVVSDDLLLSLSARQPSAALRQRLAGRLPGAQKKGPRFSFPWTTAQLALGFAILLLVILNVALLFQTQALQRQQAVLASQVQTGQTALAALAYPETRTLPVNGQNVAGTLLLDQDRNVAVLITWNMPALQPGQTFQVWLIDPQGKRTSGGIFTPQPGQPFNSVSVVSPGSLLGFSGLGVTVEPAGGSSQPSGQRILKVDF